MEMLVAGDATVATRRGTVVFADLSGFTRLTERLSRTGNEGVERLLDIIDGCFTPLLDDAYAAGGSLLKFGGDALLLWFDGPDHAARACDAALTMRSTLRRIGQIRAGATMVVLRMSVGVHTGDFHFFLVGDSHREFLIAGPEASVAVAMEAAASAGRVLVSRQTARELPRRCLGQEVELGALLARPTGVALPGLVPAPELSDELITRCFSATMLAHVIDHDPAPEHRLATNAFVSFGTFDALVQDRGPAAAAAALHELVSLAQAAATRYGVCFLGSDIGQDGGRLLLSSGAPRALGDDEERMLLALRDIVETPKLLPACAGVSRGHVFAAELGPPYRRAYALMGDCTNVAARLSAKAPFGRIYASRDVPERLRTSFALTALTPLVLKGKRRPLPGWDIGPVTGAVALGTAHRRPPLIGREHELATIDSALQDARRGVGALVELIGETGSGKSRLLAEARRLAAGMRQVHTTCQAYTRETPYAGAGDALRQLIGLRVDADDATVIAHLRTKLQRRRPELMPWLPLLTIAFGVSVPLTPEIEQLAPEVRELKLQQTVFAFFVPELRIPTLFMVEHAHVIDAASASLLRALGRELSGTAWLLLVTRRDVEGALGLEDVHPRLELEPLSPEQALALARATPEAERVPPHVLELAVRRSAGSPEFLLDLLAAAAAGNREALPDNVGAAAAARLDMLAPDDRRLVRRAAVLGMSFEPERMLEVCSEDMDMPDRAQWERLERVFARDPGGQIRFKRPALQEAAYASLPFKLRRELHGRLARALERGGPEANPALLAHHWLHAGDHVRAHRYALLGAQRARARFSHADAVGLFRHGIEAGRSAGLGTDPNGQRELGHAYEQLGESLHAVGEPENAMRAFTEARRLLRDDPVAQARLCHRHAEVAERRGSLTAAVRWLNRGLRELDGRESAATTAWRARMRAHLGGIRNRQGLWSQAVVVCRQAIAEAELVSEQQALARASYSLDWALVGLGRADQAVHSARALEIYRELADPEHESVVLNNLGMFAYYDGLWEDAVALYQRAGEASDRAGRPADVAFTDCNIGEIRSDQGAYDEAQEHLERARRIWSATGDKPSGAYASLLLARVQARQGHYDAAMPTMRTAVEDLRRYRLSAYADFAETLVAEAEALIGDPEAALVILGERLSETPANAPTLSRLRGVALARLGRHQAALEQLGEALTEARRRCADYEVASTIDALDVLGHADIELQCERDEILERLRVIRLAKPALGVRRPRAAAG
jgi:class 3 adenylate cyclase/tetratricopeptide (TPR) repeat protein